MGAMRIAVSGTGGMIGGRLVAALEGSGHEVLRLVRRESRAANEVRFAIVEREVEVAELEGADAVVHLGGYNIACRWNAERRNRIRDSRVQSTRLLAETLAAGSGLPRVLVCASAIGYYGDRGDELLTEESSVGAGFLAEVCRDWEAACEPARAAGVRVVNLRVGMVLDPSGGALKKLLLPFRLGVGGVVGNGRQYWSWIERDDVVGAIEHALATASLEGPVNAVAPDAPTNREFTKVLGRVLRRPTVFPLPAFAARIGLGQMADALLLASTRVKPAALERSGYAFRRPELEPALRGLLKAG